MSARKKILVIANDAEVAMRLREKGIDAFVTGKIKESEEFEEIVIKKPGMKKVANGNITFITADGVRHEVDEWYCVIAISNCHKLSHKFEGALVEEENGEKVINDVASYNECIKMACFLRDIASLSCKRKIIIVPKITKIYTLPAKLKSMESSIEICGIKPFVEGIKNVNERLRKAKALSDKVGYREKFGISEEKDVIMAIIKNLLQGD